MPIRLRAWIKLWMSRLILHW